MTSSLAAVILDPHARADIDKQVCKILEGLGNPEPPLVLAEVRDLLELDLEYYSSTDYGTIATIKSRLKVAGKQILKRPGLILDAIKKSSLAALYLPDRKRILLDESVPKLKHRWNESHEIGHSIIPWHQDIGHGDNDYTLHPDCHAELEFEANYAAGQLLFLASRFSEEGNSSQPSIAEVRALAKAYGNTITSTLWRYVEECHPEKALVAMVSNHPNSPMKNYPYEAPCRHFVRSGKFRDEFPSYAPPGILTAVSQYCGFRQRGPLGSRDFCLTDARGDEWVFNFSSFSNTYYVLTLGHCVGPHARAVAV